MRKSLIKRYNPGHMLNDICLMRQFGLLSDKVSLETCPPLIMTMVQ
uniref:Mobile element protein n=1 Tax=Heterorhabditis bacteriophora TaxID=37862 RepID=A0A1I7WSW1_HETBA